MLSPISNTTSQMQTSNAGAVGVQTIVEALQKSQGVINLSNGVVYDIFTIPTSFTASISSDNEANSVSKTVYLFNTDVLNAAVTDNGSGADSIVTTYGDGFSGRVYDAYLKSANNGRGIKMLGFTVIATNYTSGDQTGTAFPTMNLTLISANGQGGAIPIPFDLSEAFRNTQYLSGTLTVVKEFYLNSLCQLQYLQPKNTAFAWTFFTEASGFKG
jgi:hypothetical protein